jgi:hypothetical protein
MSHNPTADDLGSAGRGSVAHDRGPTHDATKGTQAAGSAPSMSAPNGALKTAAQELQEQSTPVSLLGQDSSLAPDAPRDDAAVATREFAITITAQPHDYTPIQAEELNGKIEGDRGEQTCVIDTAATYFLQLDYHKGISH